MYFFFFFAFFSFVTLEVGHNLFTVCFTLDNIGKRKKSVTIFANEVRDKKKFSITKTSGDPVDAPAGFTLRDNIAE